MVYFWKYVIWDNTEELQREKPPAGIWWLNPKTLQKVDPMYHYYTTHLKKRVSRSIPAAYRVGGTR
jgi:hypothetical protein